MNKIKNTRPIFAISGPSASGKGSVWAPLRDKKENICISVSHTTRPPRAGEKHGEDYHFVSDETFDEILNSNDFIEWERVHEHRYGTRKSDFLALLDKDKKIIIEIDVNGTDNLKNIFENVVTIFITPSNIESAIERLKQRNTESPKSMEIRKKRYALELEKSKEYDYIIINDDLELARRELRTIIDQN